MIQDIAPHKLHNEYEPARVAAPEDPVLCFTAEGLYCRIEDGTLFLPCAKELTETEQARLRYLFRIDETAFFLYRPEEEDASSAETTGRVLTDGDRYQPVSVMVVRRTVRSPKHLVFAVLTAHHLYHWYRTSRFCGACGARMRHAENERAMSCPSCGERVYPRINPAVIIGVTNGDRLLMTKYADRPLAYHALVAGFNEIGETLEETVRREVMEEVGLRVKNIRYYKSQPWAIADDILAGFYCDVDGDDTIRLDEKELKEGRWYARDEITGQPDDYSLTNEMMVVFREGREPK